MDIKLPINPINSPTLNKPNDSLLSLKPGQKIDVTVISDLIKAETNAIALKMANTTFTVQSNLPVKLSPGQTLQIQVTKISPTLEFAIIVSTPELKRLAIPQELRLKLITSTPADKQTIDASATNETVLPLKLPLAARIIGMSGSKIQLQVFIETDTPTKSAATTETGPTKSSVTITIDRAQLQDAKISTSGQPASANTAASPTRENAPPFKMGQAVILEIGSNEATPTFKITLASPQAIEAKINEFIRQFLPKHESSPVLLNQLIKELPQLLNNNSTPDLIQRIASQIVQNLPTRQLLNDSANLKQALFNSGLFLEAKLPELKNNPTLTIEQDFKANLLKFIEVLKKESAHPKKTDVQDIELATLKNLQQKTENNVAKIVLDQLTSLPKDETSKQVWSFEIPFVDRGQADAVHIQITKDSGNQPSSDSDVGKDKWSVTLSMNPPGLGAIQCQLSYYDETINTFFRSQQTQTSELINEHLDQLKHQFEDAGLKPGVINIQDGIQVTSSAYTITQNTLLDEKA
ncbi:MAG: flagellar hook-length control protein FliK [Methylococcaceae bacterium]|nr:flagellar hook-length control protein FliK [Methylococcaceae bacterium]